MARPDSTRVGPEAGPRLDPEHGDPMALVQHDADLWSTLVVTDLCFNVQRSASRLARFVFRADGMWQRTGPSRIIRWVGVSDPGAFHASLERILRWDFERIVPGHGDVIEREGPTALRTAWLG